METSDTFTEFQMNTSFDALREIAEAQEKAQKEAMNNTN